MKSFMVWTMGVAFPASLVDLFLLASHEIGLGNLPQLCQTGRKQETESFAGSIKANQDTNPLLSVLAAWPQRRTYCAGRGFQAAKAGVVDMGLLELTPWTAMYCFRDVEKWVNRQTLQVKLHKILQSMI